MIIGYARVSTGTQNHDLQVDALRSIGVEKIFIETASGARSDRPELMAALEFCRAGDVLAVWKLDRLARSMRQLITTIEDLEQRGVGFLSTQESIDTTSPSGRLLFHMMGALAQFEKSIILERARAGMEAAKARGRVGGRPRRLTDADIAAARAMLANDSISVKEVASRVGVSLPTLYRHIQGGRSALNT